MKLDDVFARIARSEFAVVGKEENGNYFILQRFGAANAAIEEAERRNETTRKIKG